MNQLLIEFNCQPRKLMFGPGAAINFAKKRKIVQGGDYGEQGVVSIVLCQYLYITILLFVGYEITYKTLDPRDSL